MHRLARYLNGTRDHRVWLKKEGEIQKLIIHLDTDWANCKKTRKSCACAMFRVGNCLLYSYARSQGLFLKELPAFVGQPLSVEVCLTSSAAREFSSGKVLAAYTIWRCRVCGSKMLCTDSCFLCIKSPLKRMWQT